MPTTSTTSLATVGRIAQRAATVCIAVIVLSLAAAGCATDEPLPVAPPQAAEEPSETVVSDDSAEIVADDDGLDPAPTTAFVADDSPIEAVDTSGDVEPDPETAPPEPPTATPEQEPAQPEQEIATPVTTIPEAPTPTVAPVTTEAPTPTVAPITTEAPTPTVAPITTEAPTPTVAPVTTEPTTPTVAPVTTEAPTPTVAPVTTEPTTTTVPEVFCPEGQVHMPEFTTETDPGCRAEACDNGRTTDGFCRGPDVVEVESLDDPPEEPAEPSTNPEAHPCQWQDDAADGLYGICTSGGVRYCFDHEWLVCPGGGELCPAVSGSLAFSGRGGANTVTNSVPLTAGNWRADICLSDSPYALGGFVVLVEGTDYSRVAIVDGEWEKWFVYADPNDEGQLVGEGNWSVTFEIPSSVASRRKRMLVTALAGGFWTVTFTHLDDNDTG